MLNLEVVHSERQALGDQVAHFICAKRLSKLVGFAHQRVATGEPMPGLIAKTNEQSIGSAIDDILIVAEYMPEEEIRDQVVVFLPFRG